jgi:hypothetical protein
MHFFPRRRLLAEREDKNPTVVRPLIRDRTPGR